MYSIYKHTVPNGKVYIGQTNQQPYLRWLGGSGYINNKAFYADILEYGWKNIKHEILETVETKEEAIKKERFYILEYHSNEPEYGYNIYTNATINPNERKHIKKVICVETEITYKSASDAARQLKLNQSHIHECAKHDKSRKTCGGYHWEYVEESN